MQPTIQLDLWQVILLIITVIGAFAGVGKLLLSQINKALDLRFAAIEAAATVQKQHWDARFGELLSQQKKEGESWARIERDLLTFKAELPTRYVLRDDYVRNQTIIEAKLDAVAMKIENFQLRQFGDDRSISR